MFSEAMSSSWYSSRSVSPMMARYTSGSKVARGLVTSGISLKVELSDAALVAPAVEGGGEEGVDDLEDDGGPGGPPAEAKDVGVVVPPARLGRVVVVAEGCADAAVPVGADGHPDAG